MTQSASGIKKSRLSDVTIQAGDHRPETGNVVANRALERSLTRSGRQAHEWHSRRRDDAQGVAVDTPSPIATAEQSGIAVSKAGIHSVRNGFNRYEWLQSIGGRSSGCRSCADDRRRPPRRFRGPRYRPKGHALRGRPLVSFESGAVLGRSTPLTEIPRADSSTISPAEATTGLSRARRRRDRYRDRGSRA